VPDREGCCSTDILPIRPGSALEISYLRHLLLWKPYVDRVNSLATGANLPRISPSTLLDIEIPLPPLKEQWRIAAILDKCQDLLIAKCKHRELLASFEASYFRHLFGDIGRTTPKWRLETIASCSKAIQTGPFGSLLHQADYVKDGIPIVNPKHIVNGAIVPNPNETVSPERAEELDGYRLASGDVILGRRGEMGRCAVVGNDESGYLCGTGSMFIKPSPELIEPVYLAALLSSRHLRNRLECVAIGTTLLNLNGSIVGDLLIPVPPIELQSKFAAVTGEIKKIQSLASLSISKTLASSSAIMHSCFSSG